MMTRTLTAATLVLLLTLAACDRNAPEAKPATESQTVAPEKTAANDKEGEVTENGNNRTLARCHSAQRIFSLQVGC